jgi:two-component system, NtrC family, response regulator AtoC
VDHADGPRLATTPRSGASIVVVDDEEDTAALLRDLLERRGYRAVAVSSGSQCLDYLRTEVADVVVTDMLMPGMSGVDLCHELRTRHPDLLAIVLTGVADRRSALGALRAGAYDVLTKPARTDALELVIKRALDHREVRRRGVAPAPGDAP